jgi:hypothetical protein
MTLMNKSMSVTILIWAVLFAAGCDITPSSDTNAPGADTDNIASVETPSPGGAPTFGSPSGMGFTTGNAAQSDGQGSGLMGFHDTGEYGTSGTITQR